MDWSANTGNGWAPVNRPQPKGNLQGQAQPRVNANQPGRMQSQQPSRGNQFSQDRGALDSQAQARSRGNQLSQNRSNFASQAQGRSGGGSRSGFSGGGGGRSGFSGGGGRGGGRGGR